MTRARFIAVVAALAAVVPALPAVAAADAPTVTAVAPASGRPPAARRSRSPATNFDSVQAVRFGGEAAQFHRISSTKLTATTPAHRAGA